jgi:hypothetical protein
VYVQEGLTHFQKGEFDQALWSADEAIRLPVFEKPKWLSCCALEPSTLHTHTSLTPLLVDSNAIMLPSGEMLGRLPDCPALWRKQN